MKDFNFIIDDKHYSAEWNHIRKCVMIKNRSTGIYAFELKADGMASPTFKWKNTTEHLVKVGDFIEATNLYNLMEDYYTNYNKNRGKKR